MFRLANGQNTRRAVAQTGNITPLAIPFHGLNARDSYASMAPEYAISLINVICENYGIRTRKGYTEWATNIPGSGSVLSLLSYYPPPVAPMLMPAGAELGAVPFLKFRRDDRSLMPFTLRLFKAPVSNLRPGVLGLAPPGKLFAGKNNALYNITAGGFGPWVAESGVTGVTDYWTSFNFINAGGNWLIAVNDGGGYYTYDGTTWVHVTLGSASSGQVAGINPDNFVYALQWKHRLWFIEKQSSHAWYLPTDALYGTASMFDLGPQFHHGGALQVMGSWTADGGNGINSYLIFVGSEGDIVVYQGTDPTDPNGFNIVGTWYAGPLPFGRRSITYDGGECYVLTQFGLFPISKVLSTSSLAALAVQSLTLPIDALVQRLMQDFSSLPGWNIRTLAREALVVIGIPFAATTDGGDFFAYKAPTDSWSILASTGYTCFAPIDSEIFAGTKDGRVVLAFNGSIDNILQGATTGQPIQCQVTPAYQAMGDDGFSKRFSLVRPSYVAAATPHLTMQILTDYGPPRPALIPTLPSLQQAFWNSSFWNQALWSGLQNPIRYWLGAAGKGFSATVQLDYLCGGDTLLMSIDFWTEQGNVR